MTQPPNIVQSLIHAATALEDSETAELAEQLDAFCSMILTFDTDHTFASSNPARKRCITALYETEGRELILAAVIWQLRELANQPELLATLIIRAAQTLEQRLFPDNAGNWISLEQDSQTASQPE